MTANPTEVMTEEDRQYVENQRHVQKTVSFPEKSHLKYIAIIDKLLAENASLRSSRDEYQTALELKHKWMVDADATIERLDNTARLMMEGRDKARADLSAARAEVSRLSGELASRPAKELLEAATMALDWLNVEVEEHVFFNKYRPAFQNIEDEPDAIVSEQLRSALSQASSADALSAPAKEGLTFDQFRKINTSRSARWDASAKVDIEFAGVELAGEVGEVCNAVKKLARHRMGMKGGVADTTNLAEELGDVVICADLLAMRTGIDLGEAVAKKFNATSEKHGFPERLPSAFSPAPVAAPASAVSPASEEKDAKCIGCCGRGCVACNGTGRADGRNPASVSPTPAPAPSEDDNERPVKRLADILIKNLTEFRDELRQQNKTK